MSIEEAIESLNSPGQLATTQFYNIKNNCASVLNATIDAIQTSLVLVAGGGALFPTAPFYLSCEYEVMKCTGKSTDTLTITRGFDGTTAAAHTAGVIVEQRNNAALWTDLQLAVNNIESGSTSIPFNPPAGSIANATLASDVARPNLLQNGGFEQWHYGIGPINTNTATIADGWVISNLTSGTMSVSRDSANADVGSVYCAAVVFVRTAVNVDITQIGALLTPQLRGQTISVAVRVKTNVANAVRLRVNDIITGQQFSSYHTGNNTYQTLALTYPVALTETTLNVAVEFDNSCTAYIDNATLVIGSQAANYIPAQIPDVIPNERLGTDTARANFLANGGFEVWQRGSGPFVSTSSGVMTADRWNTQQTTSGVSITVSRETTVIDAVGGTGGIAAKVVVGSGAGVGTEAGISQGVEGSAAAGQTYLKGKQVSFSIRARCDVGTLNAFLMLYDGAFTYTPITLTTTYQTFSISPLLSNSLTALAYFGLILRSAGTYYVDNAMLVMGAIPADYAPLHPADDLARCMRYCELWGGVTSEYIGTGLAFSATSGICLVPFKVRKVIVPSVTIGGIAGSGFQAQYGGGSTTVASGVSGSNTGNNGCALSLSGMSGLVAGQAILGVYGTTGFSILIEANP